MAKILFCINSFSIGGVERRLSQLIIGLGRQNYHKLFCIINHGDRFIEPEVLNYVQFILIKLSTDFNSNVISYTKIINEIKPDIIHCWTMRQCEIINKIDKTVTQHIAYICGAVNSAHVYEEGSKHKAIIEECIEKSNIIVSNSRSGLIAKMIPLKKSIIISNGYEFNKEHKNLRDTNEELYEALKKYKYKVFMACRICREKDIDMFLQVTEFYKGDENFVFLLAGDGPTCDKEFMEKIRKHLNIIFLGYRDDIESIINISNFCLLCSNPPHEEGISNFIIETMANKKIIIATSGGGTNEIVQHGVNGIIVRPHDAYQASQYISFLIQNQTLMERIQNEAYNTIKTKYNIMEKVQQYNNLYKNILSLKQ